MRGSYPPCVKSEDPLYLRGPRHPTQLTNFINNGGTITGNYSHLVLLEGSTTAAQQFGERVGV